MNKWYSLREPGKISPMAKIDLSYLDHVQEKANRLGIIPKIVIVGAGLAGAAAAYFLSALPNVHVYEAAERVGGRVKTASIYDVPQVELGAELIGSNHAMWLTLAHRLNLSFTLVTPETYYAAQGCKNNLYLNDKALSKEEEKQIEQDIKKFRDILAEDSKELSNPFEPWNMPDTLSLGDKLERCELSNLGKEYIKKQFQCDNLADPSQQSYLSILTQVKGGSPNLDGKSFWNTEQVYRCAEGNLFMVERLLQRSFVRLLHKLKSVNEHEKKCIFDFEGKEIVVSYDYLILAIPPTQYHKISGLSIPALPIGPVIKTLYIYGHRDWIRFSRSPNILALPQGEIWEATENRGDYFPFSEMNKNDRVLVNFYSDLKESQDIQRLCPYWTKYSYTENWNQNPLIEGGYSYIPPGQMKFVEYYQKSTSPYIAGEHTDPVFYGYMEGALRSGYRVANKILDHLFVSMKEF